MGDIPLNIPPGVFRGASDAEVAGRWYDAHLMRWISGVARPVPGWDRIASTVVVASKVRAVHEWIDNDGITYYGVLCESHAYVYKDGDFLDITPTGGMIGPQDNVLAGGYGTHEYNLDNYGDPRPDVEGALVIGPNWCISNWGEDLVFMTSYDGRLLRWKPSTPATKAVAVTDAPINNRCFVITPQRHCVLFGMGGNFNDWGWCSQEDIEDWDFADPLNTAGMYTVSPATRITSALATKSGILWFTTNAAYFSAYIGVPYIYDYNKIGSDVSPITPSVLVEYSDKAAWVSLNGVWSFDAGSISPVGSPLFDYFREYSDPTYTKFRAAAVNIGTQPEVWWFFPSKDKTENDQYISWNYVSQEWSKGQLARTCGTSPKNPSYPLMSDGAVLFYHEKGNYYGASPLPYLESAAINLKSGTTLSTIRQANVDHNGPYNAVYYTLFGRISRLKGATPQPEQSSRKQARPDGYLDWRMTARDFRIRIEAAVSGGPAWSFGQMILDVVQRGGR